MLSIARTVNVLENTLERPETISFLETVFVKTTITMTNAAMMALIVAQNTAIRTIALIVDVKVFQTISFNKRFPDCFLNFDNQKNQQF